MEPGGLSRACARSGATPSSGLGFDGCSDLKTPVSWAWGAAEGETRPMLTSEQAYRGLQDCCGGSGLPLALWRVFQSAAWPGPACPPPPAQVSRKPWISSFPLHPRNSSLIPWYLVSSCVSTRQPQWRATGRVSQEWREAPYSSLPCHPHYGRQSRKGCPAVIPGEGQMPTGPQRHPRPSESPALL